MITFPTCSKAFTQRQYCVSCIPGLAVVDRNERLITSQKNGEFEYKPLDIHRNLQ